MRRAPLLLLVPLTALSLAACGDDDDDEPSDTTTEVTEETERATTESTAEENEGSVESEDTLPGGITIPDLTLPEGVTLPSVEESDIVDGILRVFPDLNEDQATCLVEALDLGSGEMPDVSNLNTDLLDDCNINVQDLIPG